MIGNDEKIKFQKDSWIIDIPLIEFINRNDSDSISTDAKFKRHYYFFYSKWNIDSINSLPSDIVKPIKRIHVRVVAFLFFRKKPKEIY